jgi:peptidoglycan/LPS O-acetylase OafA/YrhL
MSFASSIDRPSSSVHMDLARGLAVIIVMLGHSRDPFFSSFKGHTAAAAPISRMGASHPQITLGNEAVMIFFVLSGYLVGGSVLRTRLRWSWKKYLTMRLTMLWVVLIPALVLTIAIDFVGLKMFPQVTSICHGPSAQGEVSQNLARLQEQTSPYGACLTSFGTTSHFRC